MSSSNSIEDTATSRKVGKLPVLTRKGNWRAFKDSVEAYFADEGIISKMITTSIKPVKTGKQDSTKEIKKVTVTLEEVKTLDAEKLKETLTKRMIKAEEANKLISQTLSGADILRKISDEEDNYHKYDSKLYKVLYLQLESTVQRNVPRTIRKSKSGYKLWWHLVNTKEKNSVFRKLSLLASLFRVAMKSGETMEDYVAKIDHIIEKLENIGVTVEDDYLICALLLAVEL